MNNHLEALALRLRDDPFFLANTLQLYAESEGMDEPRLANALGCSEETLVLVRLCRAPEATRFNEDVERIALKFQLNRDALAQAVRGGQAIFQMRKMSGGNRGALLAARDDDPPQPRNKERDDA